VSRYWSIQCLDCGEAHTFLNANHRDAEMAALCRHAAAIAALAPLFEDPGLGFWELELQTPEGRIDPRWFAEHAGHRLVPIDEYGHLLTQCPVYVDCAGGSPRRCTLDYGHAGDHDPTDRWSTGARSP
jgi:hypothetical protein